MIKLLHKKTGRMKPIKHVVSVSGGKDSAATLLLALERCSKEHIIPIFCDTGNEHREVYEYLIYLERALGVQIVRLKADFSEQIAAKRVFIARDRRNRREYDTVPVFEADGVTPVLKRNSRGEIVMQKVRRGGVMVLEPAQKTRKIGGGRRVRWTNKAKRRALAVLYPTGNPFLDLCLWKGRFPSRKAQFCTEELKRNMAVSFQIDLIDQGYKVVSWQGVRRDESQNRRNAKLFERIGRGMYAFRPLVEWTAADVFGYCRSKGLEPNPLYKQGMGRVGCMPCINCGKEEISQIAVRFHEHLEEKARWERLVSQASKQGFSTFFNKELHENGGRDLEVAQANRIEAVVEWAKTGRGGRQMSFMSDFIEPSACSSAYGLCE